MVCGNDNKVLRTRSGFTQYLFALVCNKEDYLNYDEH